MLNVKRHPDNTIDRFNARLVAFGCQQRLGVADLGTVSVLMTVVAKHKQDVHHLDVTIAFLYGVLQWSCT